MLNHNLKVEFHNKRHIIKLICRFLIFYLTTCKTGRSPRHQEPTLVSDPDTPFAIIDPLLETKRKPK